MKIPTTTRSEDQWLELVRREVRAFRFGVMELAVVDGEVTQVETVVVGSGTLVTVKVPGFPAGVRLSVPSLLGRLMR